MNNAMLTPLVDQISPFHGENALYEYTCARQFISSAELVRLRDYLEQLKATVINEKDTQAMERGEKPVNVRLDKTWFSVWEGLSAESQAFLGDYLYVIYPPQVRHVQELSHYVPWHQDIAYGRLMPLKHENLITCFIPIEDEPAKHTTLRFAVNRGDDDIIQHVPLGKFGAGFEESTTISDFEYFQLELGDALIFGGLVPHQTYTPDDCDVARRSLEFRLVSKAHMVSGKDYYDIANKKFVRKA